MLATLLRHQRHGDTRINASTEKRAQRHVADHSHPNRVGQKRPKRLTRFDFSQIRVDFRFDSPILVGLHITVLVHESLSRRELTDALVDRPRMRNHAESEIMIDRFRINPPRDFAARQNGLELRPEEEETATTTVIERLLPQAVARGSFR